MIKTLEKWLKYGAYTVAIYDIFKYSLKRLREIDRDIQRDIQDVEAEIVKDAEIVKEN